MTLRQVSDGLDKKEVNMYVEVALKCTIKLIMLCLYFYKNPKIDLPTNFYPLFGDSLEYCEENFEQKCNISYHSCVDSEQIRLDK